ncbi:MAG: sensor histidine kinase [Ignavibacteriales bacterium]|nr:sensor histidine kinase [Ignavibacteriales bacterium]
MPTPGSEIWLALVVGTTAIVILGGILLGSIMFSQKRFINSQREKVRILEESERQLKESYDKVRQFAVHLQSVREEERTRIAREIHDELGQLLTVMKMDIALLSKKIKSQNENRFACEAIKSLQTMSGLADSTIQSVRRIATQLRPEILDELGLREAIEWETGLFQERTKILTNFSSSKEFISLDPERATALFRIFQETLTNIARHSQATQIDVTIDLFDSELILLVSDNGKGITQVEATGSRSLGLLGMRERAQVFGGSVDITGIPGKGTMVKVRVPLKPVSAST